MSSIEERLARDIAAVTGGVVVTDEDLRGARTAVDERIDSSRRRRRLGAAAAAAIVVAAVGVTALQAMGGDEDSAPPASPAPSRDPHADHLAGDPPTPETLAGIWRVDNGVHIMKFDTNGTVQFDKDGMVISHADADATYQIEGKRIRVSASDDDRGACRFEIRGALSEPGILNYVLDGPGASCARMTTGVGRLERVVPPSSAITGLDHSKATGWAPLTDASMMWGFLFNEGGGFGLELAPDGGYVVVDFSAKTADHGDWTLRGRELTLESDDDSATCEAGDRLVLSGMEYLPELEVVLRGTVTRNDCGRAWAVPRWIVLPSDIHN